MGLPDAGKRRVASLGEVRGTLGCARDDCTSSGTQYAAARRTAVLEVAGTPLLEDAGWAAVIAIPVGEAGAEVCVTTTVAIGPPDSRRVAGADSCRTGCLDSCVGAEHLFGLGERQAAPSKARLEKGILLVLSAAGILMLRCSIPWIDFRRGTLPLEGSSSIGNCEWHTPVDCCGCPLRCIDPPLIPLHGMGIWPGLTNDMAKQWTWSAETNA